jgi:hypothetical protein
MDYWSPGGEGIEKVWEAIVRILQDECVISSLSIPTQRLHIDGKSG